MNLEESESTVVFQKKFRQHLSEQLKFSQVYFTFSTSSVVFSRRIINLETRLHGLFLMPSKQVFASAVYLTNVSEKP